MEPENLRAAVGPNADYYLRQFERLEQAKDGWVSSWNWPAFFCGTAWFAYRRMPWFAIASLVMALLLATVSTAPWSPVIYRGPELLYAYLALVFGVVPLVANRLYRATLTRQPAMKPPTFATGLSGAGLQVLLVVSVAFSFISGFGAHSQVRESVHLTYGLEGQLKDFYAEKRRLPSQREVDKFEVSRPTLPSRFTRSVRYDASAKRITVTLEGWYFAGKSYVILVSENAGTLEFTCRTEAVDPLFIPRKCTS